MLKFPVVTIASLRQQLDLSVQMGRVWPMLLWARSCGCRIYKAINRIVGIPNRLTEFTVKSVSEGIDAIGEVLIRIESEDVTYTGRGASTDIIVASAKAYMNALNRLLAAKKGLVMSKVKIKLSEIL